LQISTRFPGTEARLSPFLTGITIPDAVTGEQRTFADLDRRSSDLQAIVCTALAVPTAKLRKGVDRVH
jgi:hypothetical protein